MHTVRSLFGRSMTSCLVSLLATSCLVTSSVTPVETFSPWASDRPVLSVGDVHMVDGLTANGIGIDRNGQLVIPKNYPTESDPHVLLGIYQVGYRSAGKLPREKEREMAIQVAAKHGANAVYDGSPHGKRAFYLLYLSSADPVYPPAGPFLDELEKAYGRGSYKRYGTDLARTLEGFEAVTLPVQSMTCFRAAVALDVDARLGPKLGTQIQVVINAHGRERAISVPLQKPLPRSRSFLIQLGCYANSQGVSWKMAAFPASKPLGSGPAVVRTFAMAADMRLRKHQCSEMQDTDRASAREEGMCVP